MEPYREMYYRLFHSTARIIEALQQAQRETEEMFISVDKPDIKLVGNVKSKDERHDKEK